MAATYTKFDRTDFETALDDAGYDLERVDPADLKGTRELVYDIDSGHENFPVRVFSSVHVDDDNARDAGRDAIRTVLWDAHTDAPCDGATRTHRIDTWLDNLTPKIDAMIDAASEHASAEDEQLGALEAHEFDAGEFRTNGTVFVADVWKNDYDDVRIALGGDTYEAFKQHGVKSDLDWDETHHSFNDNDGKHWHVDASAVAHLHDALADAGFALLEAEPTDDLAAAIDAADEGDEVEITYETKNAGTDKTVAGTVHHAADDAIVFERAGDDHTMFVYDNDNRRGLYTSGSHFPFVGSIKAVDLA